VRRAVLVLLLAACGSPPLIDAGSLPVPVDAGVDAGRDAGRELLDGGPHCGCTPGLHGERIYLVGAEGGLHTFDPVTLETELVVGPACASVDSPFSLAIAPSGLAWILYSSTRRMLTIDVNALAACEDSGYLPTLAELPLFGMSFVDRGGCSSLYAFSYSGDGPFREGPDLGVLARIDGDPPRAAVLSSIDYDGGELAGTGDGRLFAFTGDRPAKLVELDPDDGAALETFPLERFHTTLSSAFAFFGGDIYFFTEAIFPECEACLASSCAAWPACDADPTCREQIDCAVVRGDWSDECGGGAGNEMLTCVEGCSAECLVWPPARVSQVTRLDWDESDGPGRTREVIVDRLPLRVVGADTSPCVPTGPI